MIFGERIKILGAGISGMVAGIILAKKGYKVEIFEKRPRIGSFFKRDVHSFRNYYYNYDVLKRYKSLGIKISHTYPIFREFRFSPSFKKIEIYSKNRPLFYNFIRGYDSEKSLDAELYKTAKKLGVEFHFNKIINKKKIDIVATGARSVKGIGYGEHYSKISGMVPNSNYIFLNNRYSPQGYSCILPFNNEATIVLGSTKKESKDELRKRFNFLKSNNPIIKKIIKNAKFENEIFGFIFYDFPKTAIENGKLRTGEAGGFLDAATVFGTHYAILSGYLAAKAIIKNMDYDKLWSKTFGKELEAQYLRRKKLQQFSNKDYEATIESLIKKHGDRMAAATYRENKNKEKEQK